MNLKDKSHIYFIGIGGIGMSAIARYFLAIGKQVAGYDKTPSPVTASLIKEGAAIHFEDSEEVIPKEFKNKDDVLVIYTPAIPKNHSELNFFNVHRFNIKKRAEVLGAITEGIPSLAVAGTHGKTTTTAILGHLLKESGVAVTAFLGGISTNYNSNLILTGNEVIVVEADEFDRSFLQLYPSIAAITSTDADHLDIYGEKDQLDHSFRQFAAQVKQKLLVKKGLDIEGLTFGIEENADYDGVHVTIKNGVYHFDLKTPEGLISGLRFVLPGRHNLLNAITALSIALLYGADVEKLKNGLHTFKGVQRRFTYHIKQNNLVYIDDYAHHPTEIEALFQAVTEMYPDKKVAIFFQPHLFSRTQDFAEGFARSLEKFDKVRVLDIYPARELPIEGVTSAWLLELMDHQDKKIVDKSSLAEEVKKVGTPVVLSVGAGDIGEEVETIKNALLTI